MNAPCGQGRWQGKTPQGLPCVKRSDAAAGAADELRDVPGAPRPPSVTPELADEELLTAYLHGQEACFALLVQRYEKELFHFLVRFLGDRTAAEDVFQETFLQVHQSADQFDPERRFRPWLFTIATNKARDHIRSQSRRAASALEASIDPSVSDGDQFVQLMSSSDVPADVDLEEAEVRQQVNQTVMRMPLHLREILILAYFNEFSYKQIAEIIDVPLGTVKSRLHAAVACFADLWRAVSENKPPSGQVLP